MRYWWLFRAVIPQPPRHGAERRNAALGGRYHFGEPQLSVGLDYVQYDSEFDQLELGLRYQFN